MNTKTAIFTFGKFDPPCAQDEDLVKAMVTAKGLAEGEADVFLFPSRSTKNLMPFELRRHYLNLAFAQYGVRIMNVEKAIDPFKSMDHLIVELGYKRVVAVFFEETAAKLKDLEKYTADAESFEMTKVGTIAIPGDRSVGALMNAATTREHAKFKKACPVALAKEPDYYDAVQKMLDNN